MAAARKTQNDTNKETAENSVLVAYRLQAVETALNILTNRFDNQDNIKKADLKEIIDTIVSRLSDVKADLQKQIDKKADAQELKDFKKQVGALGIFVSMLVVAAFSYMLTRLH